MPFHHHPAGAAPAWRHHLACLLMGSALALSAQETPLEPGKTFDRTLGAGKSDAFSASLTNGHLVTVRLVAKTEAILSATAPSGKVRRVISSRVQEGNPFTFLASESGIWRFVVQGRDPETPVSYELSGFSSESLSLPPLPGEPASARLQQVKSQEDAKSFWKEMEQRGTPLVEPMTDDPRSVLVTYLWRDDGETLAVLLESAACSSLPMHELYLKRYGQTDIWFKSVVLDRRTRDTYRFILNPPKLEGIERAAFPVAMAYYRVGEATAVGDPLNAKSFPAKEAPPGIHRGRSYFELPGAPSQPWAERREGLPAGTVAKTEISSAILKNKRDLHIYLPPGYTNAGAPYNLLLAFDGTAYVDVVPTPVTLDNLLAEKRIAPTVAVMIGSPNRDSELPWNKAFCDFLALELVPWLRRNYHITADPRRVILAGSSYGGLAAASAAFHHPMVFGNVLSQSGSFWWTPPPDPTKEFTFDPRAEPTYVAQQFLQSPRLPIRFYMDAGTLEVDTTGKGGAILLPNRHLRDLLRAKGYEVFYQEFQGGHDYSNWRGTLADGLILLQ